MLLKSYHPPLSSRGVRGTAGSGRGVRTVMEYISLKYACNFDKKRNVVDYMFSLYPDVNETKRKTGQSERRNAQESKAMLDGMQVSGGYVNFDDNSLTMPAVRIPTPKAVTPLHIPSRDFPKQCCNITSSFEDSLFSVSLVMEFLGLGDANKAEPTSPTEVQREMVCFLFYCVISYECVIIYSICKCCEL